MTAEIAILNRSAVALAADSMVTVSGPGVAPKTYHVNKLFALSKHRPVGVMVYGSAELLGVPWETVIKSFRHELSRAEYSHLGEYVNAFTDYLNGARLLFPETAQWEYARRAAEACFDTVWRRTNDELNQEATRGIAVNAAVIARVSERVMQQAGEEFRARLLGDGLSDDFVSQYRQRYDGAIAAAFHARFDGFPGCEQLRPIALEVAAEYATRANVQNPLFSGIVVAGFCASDVFPKVVPVEVFGVALDKLIRRRGTEVSGDDQAAVLPFAQRDVVDGFLNGAEDNLLELMRTYLQELLRQIPGAVSSLIPTAAQSEAVELLDNALAAAFRSFDARLMHYIVARHVEPLRTVIQVLPKEELAALAESLVHITSIKRKVSLQTETVGGPIDVALVTKGDGFIWVKRKHYFDPGLNPHFFENYFQR